MFANVNHAAYPTPAEGQERVEIAQERQAPVADSVNDIGGLADSCDGHSADHAVLLNADAGLQIFGGPTNAGVDGEVEHGIVQPTRQEVALHPIPVLELVDRLRFILADKLDRLIGRARVLR